MKKLWDNYVNVNWGDRRERGRETVREREKREAERDRERERERDLSG